MGYTEREAFLPTYPSKDNVPLNVSYGSVLPGVTVEAPVWTDEGIERMKQVIGNAQEIRDVSFGNVQGDNFKYEYQNAQHPFVNPAGYDPLLEAALNKNKDVPQQLGITPDKYTQGNWWLWVIVAIVIILTLSRG